MSCKNKWAEYNKQLQAATQLAPGSADAVPRCSKPECNRPLMKDGTCVMGHAQTAGEPAPAVAPLAEALRCAVDEELQAAIGRNRYFSSDSRIASVRAMADRLASAPDDPKTLRTLLTTVLQIHNQTHYAWQEGYESFFENPVLQAAVTTLAETQLTEAAALASSPDPAQRRQAIDKFLAIENWAEEWHNQAIQQRAQRGRQQILPVAELEQTAWVLATQLNAAIGGRAFKGAWGRGAIPELLVTGTGVPIEMVDTEELDLYPDEVRSFLRRELGAACPTASSWTGDTPITISTDAISSYLWQRLREHEVSISELESEQADMAPVAGQLSPVQFAQQHALPFYQGAAQLQEAQEENLRALGAPGEALLQRIIAVKAQALQSLQAVPLRELPQAVAALRFEPRVMDLLKFKTVREAVFNPQNSVDLLTHLPQLAPRAIAAVKDCELVESVLAKKTVTADDRRLRGPQSDEEVAILVQAGALLDRVAEEQLAARAGEADKPDRWRQAVATLVNALSEHAPPSRAPMKLGADGGYADESRLAQARAARQDMWGRGLDTALFTPAAVRKWADAGGMPLGRYADRESIVAWLQDPDPASRANRERNVRHALRSATPATMRAVDRTGADLLYKKGDRVCFNMGGRAQEGVIVGCLFQASAEVDHRDNYPPEVPLALTPAVRVQFSGGRQETVPISGVEAVKKKKK